jgi:D-specific alpha-keto acid dehydrogenase
VRTASHLPPAEPMHPPVTDYHGCRSDRGDDSSRLGLTIYGCEPDEARLFRQLASRFRVVPTITSDAIAQCNVALASGNRCISIGHKTTIDNPTLLSLSRAGVAYISTRSIGYDHVDLEYAARVGICVENIAYAPDGVADYTLMLMLMLVRNAKWTLRRVEAHDYRLHDVRAHELRDMTIGVVGTGRIGSAVIERLQGFGCRVVASDRYRKASVDYLSLDALLEQSDVVTLHTPLNAGTRHLLGRQRLERMKQDALLVNTGRGPLIETKALVLALESGRLGGAALDVVEGEEGIFYCDRSGKAVENSLLLRLQRLPNVLISPHTAYYTDRALSDTVERTLINCRRFEGRAAWTG